MLLEPFKGPPTTSYSCENFLNIRASHYTVMKTYELSYFLTKFISLGAGTGQWAVPWKQCYKCCRLYAKSMNYQQMIFGKAPLDL